MVYKYFHISKIYILKMGVIVAYLCFNKWGILYFMKIVRIVLINKW